MRESDEQFLERFQAEIEPVVQPLGRITGLRLVEEAGGERAIEVGVDSRIGPIELVLRAIRARGGGRVRGPHCGSPPRARLPGGRPGVGGSARLLGYDRAMATLSRSDVEHVAYLARLGLTDDELTLLEGQLNHILDQYTILATLDTDAIPPTAQTIELENILREDVAAPSLPTEAVLGNAPAREGDFFLVPPILTERD